MGYLLFLFAIILSSTAYSQEETLFTEEGETGGFGAPVVKFTAIKNQAAIIFGGRGGWVFNHSLILGGGIYGIISEVDAPNGVLPKEGPLDIELDYIGAEVEYVFHPMQLYHYNIYTLIGSGTARFVKDVGSVFNSNEQAGESDLVFVLEPGVNCEVNVTTWFRIDAGVSYRLVTGVNQPKLKSSDFCNFAASLTFKFGSF
jgi:hypothetical protein